MVERLANWWRDASRGRRAVVVAGCVAVVVLASAGAMLATGVGQPARGVAATPPVLVTTVGPTHTATPSGPTTPTPTPTPTTVKTLKELKERFGDAPEANRGRFRIPSLGVDAPLSQRSVGANLDLQYLNPYGPADVTWYDFSVSPRYGGTPGGGRNAIFAGHVDYADPIRHAPNVNYFGPGVFRNIDLVAPGDTVEVTMGGRTTTFSVVWKRLVGEHDDWSAVYEGTVPEGDSITIITCSGTFNPATREYDSRTVIRASRA